MLDRIADYLRKLNGAAYLGRRIEAVDGRVIRVEKDIHALSQALGNHLQWQRYLGFEAPLYLLQDGRLALSREVVDAANRVALISIPKSGTYLLAALLEGLGMHNTGVHVWESGFHDYRGKTIPEMVHRYSEFAVNAPLAKTVDLVMPGQYVLGHIGCDGETKEALAPFRRVLAVRELRQCLVSHMRFFANEGRGMAHGGDWKQIEDPRRRMHAFLELYAGELLSWARSILGWQDDAATLRVRFEDLLGDSGRQVQSDLVCRLADHVGVRFSAEQVPGLLASVLNRPTKTWSGKRSALGDWWDGHCEAVFQEHGGVALNESLGYVQDDPPFAVAARE